MSLLPKLLGGTKGMPKGAPPTIIPPISEAELKQLEERRKEERDAAELQEQEASRREEFRYEHAIALCKNATKLANEANELNPSNQNIDYIIENADKIIIKVQTIIDKAHTIIKENKGNREINRNIHTYADAAIKIALNAQEIAESRKNTVETFRRISRPQPAPASLPPKQAKLPATSPELSPISEAQRKEDEQYNAREKIIQQMQEQQMAAIQEKKYAEEAARRTKQAPAAFRAQEEAALREQEEATALRAQEAVALREQQAAAAFRAQQEATALRAQTLIEEISNKKIIDSSVTFFHYPVRKYTITDYIKGKPKLEQIKKEINAQFKNQFNSNLRVPIYDFLSSTKAIILNLDESDKTNFKKYIIELYNALVKNTMYAKYLKYKMKYKNLKNKLKNNVFLK